MTKKDIDLLTRFIEHVDFLLGIIKVMNPKSTYEAEILSKVQKTLPSMLKEFINFEDSEDNITKIERAKDDGYKKGNRNRE